MPLNCTSPPRRRPPGTISYRVLVRSAIVSFSATVQTVAKSVAWRVLLFILLVSNRRAGLVLVYHDVADRDGDPQSELVPPVSQQRFTRQLKHLRRYYRVVPLAELQLAVAARRRWQRFPVAVTFDDDLDHHYTRALPVLHKVDVPATFFLCGSFLDSPPRDFWWQRLQRAVDAGADVTQLAGTGTIHDQGHAIARLSPERRDDVASELGDISGTPPPGVVLTATHALELPQIGFHTIRHDTLTQLDDDQLTDALTDGRVRLAEFVGQPVDMIAYPHGRSDRRVEAAARECGFAIGVTGRPEAVRPGTDPLAMGRYEPTGHAPTRDVAFDLVRLLSRPPDQENPEGETSRDVVYNVVKALR